MLKISEVKKALNKLADANIQVSNRRCALCPINLWWCIFQMGRLGVKREKAALDTLATKPDICFSSLVLPDSPLSSRICPPRISLNLKGKGLGFYLLDLPDSPLLVLRIYLDGYYLCRFCCPN